MHDCEKVIFVFGIVRTDQKQPHARTATFFFPGAPAGKMAQLQAHLILLLALVCRVLPAPSLVR